MSFALLIVKQQAHDSWHTGQLMTSSASEAKALGALYIGLLLLYYYYSVIIQVGSCLALIHLLSLYLAVKLK